ncbi:hypothetical protein M747DRAFT_346153 [Aspergillus niger ATCC 13496]|uniref:Uncharacterized protein n=1 Tax=Aspergillus niger ATCC 13496 TaxID=1353008 RepID=A0A370BPR3_ASPNG|nr:hypothetical protein M747DRAFT_346153 [Aspergillus niger ATCC 13496]
MQLGLGSEPLHWIDLLTYLPSHRFVFRENRVPYYQRLFQQHDGKRQWWKTERSGYLMWPYLISVYGMGIATTYAMGRMVFGHKTWFGKA